MTNALPRPTDRTPDQHLRARLAQIDDLVLIAGRAIDAHAAPAAQAGRRRRQRPLNPYPGTTRQGSLHGRHARQSHFRLQTAMALSPLYGDRMRSFHVPLKLVVGAILFAIMSQSLNASRLVMSTVKSTLEFQKFAAVVIRKLWNDSDVLYNVDDYGKALDELVRLIDLELEHTT